MSLWPASDEITLSHSGGQVRLRPSLRAASVYAVDPGMGALFNRIDDFHLATVADVIMTCATDRSEATAFLKSFEPIGEKPLLNMIAAVKSPIGELARAFIPEPAQPLDMAKGKATGKPMDWPEVYRNLYHTATGWLGWTPREAWNATPNEINHAFAGHIAMLKATGVLMADKEDQPDTYSADDLKHVQEQGHDPAFDRSAFNAFRQKLGGDA